MGNVPKRTRVAAAAAALLTIAASAAAQDQAQQVEVIGTSPLTGLGVERDRLPYSSQVLQRGAIDRAQTGSTTDLLARRVPGMQVNDIQGSPFQSDLTYRGYRASGLLGAAQGLSVYLDGVRINEPFGDVVLWDLLPEFSLQSISVVPGANPAFGLNTLGGALAFTTADGRSAPGLRAEVGFGSFARKRIDASYGHHDDGSGWHQYIAASGFDEDGWRDQSPGDLANVLAKIGRDDGVTQWDVALLAARSDLIGNGMAPLYTFDDEGNRTPDLLDTRWESVFTHPDRTRNKLGQLAFNWSHQVDPASRLQGLAYVRGTHRDTVNGDAADEAGEIASLNATTTRQTAYGAAVSLARRSGDHQWQVGASIDANRVRFEQTEQEGAFDDTRGVVPEDGALSELSAKVEGRSVSAGLYATDTWRVAPRTYITGTLRLNRSRVSNQLTSVDDDSGLLEAHPEESFNYTSANPALGIAQGFGDAFTAYANIARNTRVPTVIELGCANPDEPCRLPAGLQSDPFLEQVRSTSVELGARWRPAPAHRLELALYRTDNRDDIVFSSVSATSQLGYFQNFARTRHRGADLSWQGDFGAVSLDAAAGWLRATYEADGLLRMGERNVVVTPGTRMAGLPEHSLKIGGDWRITPQWSIGADVQRFGGRVVQGNEDGLIEDGATERVDLSLPGYSVTNLRLSWRPRAGIELMARVNNVFDKRYSSYGAIAETVFDAQGNYTGDEADAVFVAPGTPRSFYVGLRLAF
jgi:outer membrane receptor protein involved in Fe transport